MQAESAPDEAIDIRGLPSKVAEDGSGAQLAADDEPGAPQDGAGASTVRVSFLLSNSKPVKK